MGVSNPSARGYAVPTMVSTAMQNREQVGGPAKAGLGRHIGMGPFVYAAIVAGASGHPAPHIAGPNYPSAYAAFLAGWKTGRGAPAGVTGPYPISTTNQLSGVGMPRWGMTRAPADGVNMAQREQATQMVRFFNPLSGRVAMTRGLTGPDIPPNPPHAAPGHGFPWGGMWQRN